MPTRNRPRAHGGSLTAALVAIGLLVGACGGSDAATETIRIWVLPGLVDCEGAHPQTCMQVADSVDGEYSLFYDSIEGFEPQEDTGYVLDVQLEHVDDPAADASSDRYTLVEIIDETPGG